jgi:hypothetical protein
MSGDLDYDYDYDYDYEERRGGKTGKGCRP